MCNGVELLLGSWAPGPGHKGLRVQLPLWQRGPEPRGMGQGGNQEACQRQDWQARQAQGGEEWGPSRPWAGGKPPEQQVTMPACLYVMLVEYCQTAGPRVRSRLNNKHLLGPHKFRPFTQGLSGLEHVLKGRYNICLETDALANHEFVLRALLRRTVHLTMHVTSLSRQVQGQRGTLIKLLTRCILAVKAIKPNSDSSRDL